MTVKNEDLLLSARERAEYGCTVTFENEAGKVFVIVRQGRPRAGLREACEIALQLDPTFRIVSYSTPSTIYCDMRGRRMNDKAATPLNVELTVASQSGVRHLVHDRIRVASDSKYGEAQQRFQKSARDGAEPRA